MPGEGHEFTFSCYQRLKLLTCECVGRACAASPELAPETLTETGCPLCGRGLIACRWLADSINKAARSLDFAVLGYVFMPEHVHLALYPHREHYDISQILKQIKEPVARQAMAHLERNAPAWLQRLTRRRGNRVERLFWQSGGGYDRNVAEERTRDNMIEYAHANPCERGLVDDPLDWPFSSARYYAELGEGLVRIEPV